MGLCGQRPYEESDDPATVFRRIGVEASDMGAPRRDPQAGSSRLGQLPRFARRDELVPGGVHDHQRTTEHGPCVTHGLESAQIGSGEHPRDRQCGGEQCRSEANWKQCIEASPGHPLE